jgi:hypothetical protein
MNDKKLDEILNNGKREAEGFFSHVAYAPLRRALLHKVSQPDFGKRHLHRVLKIGTAAAACAAAVLCLVLGLGQIPSIGASTQNAPISEQAVPLGAQGSTYHISFQPLRIPKNSEPSLISILWRQNSSQSAEMVYNSLFEKSDQPYPVSIVGFPGGSVNKILLISTHGSGGDYMHYRLVEYTEDALYPVWSQDFVPGGSLTIQDGMVVEQRQKDESTNSDTTAATKKISYIVPYMADARGAVILPVSILRLRVGDQILFVGENSLPIKADIKNGRMTASGENTKQTDAYNILAFEASRPGADELSLYREDLPADNTLPLEITR